MHGDVKVIQLYAGSDNKELQFYSQYRWAKDYAMFIYLSSIHFVIHPS